MYGESNSDFNEARAEVFEALGHPTRIRILQALNQKPLGFSELKKEVGIESSGHLAFHLGKLSHLIRTDQTGLYNLTDDGKEALRIVEVSRTDVVHIPSSGRSFSILRSKLVIVGLLVAIIVLSSVAVIQQQQISGLNSSLDGGTTVVNGLHYWHMSSSGPGGNGSRISFHGVEFTVISPPDYQSGTVRLTNGTIITFTPATTIRMDNFTGVVLSTNQSLGTYLATVLMSEVLVTFPDGSRGAFDPITVTYNRAANLLIFAANSPLVNPWFSQHQNPSVGIRWNPGNGTLEYYVSIS